MIAALITLVLGTASLFLAAASGHSAAELADREGGVAGVLKIHEELGEESEIVFGGLTAILFCMFLVPNFSAGRKPAFLDLPAVGFPRLVHGWDPIPDQHGARGGATGSRVWGPCPLARESRRPSRNARSSGREYRHPVATSGAGRKDLAYHSGIVHTKRKTDAYHYLIRSVGGTCVPKTADRFQCAYALCDRRAPGIAYPLRITAWRAERGRSDVARSFVLPEGVGNNLASGKASRN